jgi:hypothetical protein
MGLLNRGNTSAVTLRKPLPILDVTHATTIEAQTDALSASAGAAGTTGTLMCTLAPIASANGDLVGNFIDSSVVVTSTALTTEVPFELIAARAAANQNLSTVGEGAPDYKSYLLPGEFYIIYETGRIFYSKEDNSTDVSVAYKYRVPVTSVTADIDLAELTLKDGTAATLATVLAASTPPALTNTSMVVSIRDRVPMSVYASAALEASGVVKNAAGLLRLFSGRLDSSAATGTYYFQLLNANALPADGAVTTLAAPTKLIHTTGSDTPIHLDFTDNMIAASTGIVFCLSSTEFTKTISGAYLSGTVLFQ